MVQVGNDFVYLSDKARIIREGGEVDRDFCPLSESRVAVYVSGMNSF